jgi:hypothetical protein
MKNATFLAVIILLLTQSVLAQKANSIYLQFGKKATPSSINYDYRVYQTADTGVQIFGHVGFGSFAQEEILKTKVIPASYINPNTGSTVVDLILFFTFREPSYTKEQKQYTNINFVKIGSKILFGKDKIKLEVGLNSRIDFVKQETQIWENEAAKTSQFTTLSILPSSALRYDGKKMILRSGIELNRAYNNPNNYKFEFFLGAGLQF